MSHIGLQVAMATIWFKSWPECCI